MHRFGISTGNGAGTFSGRVKGLKGQTMYYIRAYATNNKGTGYGSTFGVTTIDTMITDIDNNHYRIVQIGIQVWMAENLRVTHYRNNQSIPNITDNSAWNGLTSGAYCWYNNDPTGYKSLFGALYNWYAVSDSRDLSPAGWHIPSDAEWTTLTTYLGGESVSGGKMKSTAVISSCIRAQPICCAFCFHLPSCNTFCTHIFNQCSPFCICGYMPTSGR